MVDVGVDGDVDAALPRRPGHPFARLEDVGLEEVLRDAHQPLRGQTDVPDVLDLEESDHEVLQPADRHVGHIAAGDDDVPHRGRAAEVVEHVLPPFVLLLLEPILQDLGRVVADQVHAGAVPAVLGTGGQELGQDLRRVAVGQALHGPHVGLV
jgi:hypothetical protein